MERIAMLVMDVDGTLTDGKIYISEAGELMKAFHVRDGYIIKELPKYGITPVVITGRQSKIVEYRMEELGVGSVLQGINDKLVALKKIAEASDIPLRDIAYIGDDLNDLSAMQVCGFKACPADAVSEIKSICDYISAFGGGNGAVRDICEHIVELTNGESLIT